MTESDCVSLPGWSVCVKVCDPSELSCPLLGDEQSRGGVGAAPSVCGPEVGEVLEHCLMNLKCIMTGPQRLWK